MPLPLSASPTMATPQLRCPTMGGPEPRCAQISGREAARHVHVRQRMEYIIAGAVMRVAHADNVVGHRFAAGHVVHLDGAVPFCNAAGGNYEVVAQLPERDGEFQYRIKSVREPYQRIVREGELETVWPRRLKNRL
jgi:hypothetical protein